VRARQDAVAADHPAILAAKEWVGAPAEPTDPINLVDWEEAGERWELPKRGVYPIWQKIHPNVMLEIQATRDRAADELARTHQQIAGLEAALAGAKAELQQRRDDEARTLAALHHSDARMSAVAEELARFGSSARSAAAEAERLERQREAAELARRWIEPCRDRLRRGSEWIEPVGGATPSATTVARRQLDLDPVGRGRLLHRSPLDHTTAGSADR
jgi:hypothetical protein